MFKLASKTRLRKKSGRAFQDEGPT